LLTTIPFTDAKITYLHPPARAWLDNEYVLRFQVRMGPLLSMHDLKANENLSHDNSGVALFQSRGDIFLNITQFELFHREVKGVFAFKPPVKINKNILVLFLRRLVEGTNE
jgi:hypothetical protein